MEDNRKKEFWIKLRVMDVEEEELEGGEVMKAVEDII